MGNKAEKDLADAKQEVINKIKILIDRIEDKTIIDSLINRFQRARWEGFLKDSNVCVLCKHCERKVGGIVEHHLAYVCRHPLVIPPFSFVTGLPEMLQEEDMNECNNMRKTSGFCGTEGKYWEAK